MSWFVGHYPISVYEVDSDLNDADKIQDPSMSELTELRQRVAELEARETEHKRLEETLARLATFPEQNPNPVIETDVLGHVTYLNPVAKEHFPDLATAGLQHPILEGLESTIHTFKEGQIGSFLRELELGDRIYEQKTTYMAQTHIVRIFVHEITELKRLEETLARLATFPEQNPNPVIETDLLGHVTYLNPVAKEHFPDLATAGLQHPILEGLESIIHTFKEGLVDSFLREIELGDRIYEQKTTYMAQTHIVRIFAYEITELKRLQEQLQENLTELEQTNKYLQQTQVQLVQSEKMAAMASLVAGIAHEINTPIGAISSVHDTLGRAVDKLKVILADEIPQTHQNNRKINTILQVISDASNVIKTGSERVKTTVQSLRNFARLDEAELKSVDVHEGLKNTLKLVQHHLGDRIEVVKNYGDVPPILCYPGRLNQVFLCFLINAIEAIEGTGKIVITISQQGDKLQVAIKDTGTGIPDEHLDRIFEPGFTTKGVGVGTGLGLSICYQIVQDHKGEIQVETKVGEGTTFTTVLAYSFSGFILR
ncbi:MAG: signal transduction histidine kinase [Candidatus Latescibacterota bacterium]